MAMKKCKECGEEISSSAKKCPKCGKDQRNFFMKHPVLYTIVILIIIGVVASSGGNTNNNTTQTNGGSSETTTSTKKEKFTLEDDHIGSSDQYGMSYTIEGSIKNNTDKQYSYVQVTFNLYDSDGAQIGTALANINNLEANGLWKFKAIGSLGDGKSVASYKLMEITGW